MSLEIHTPKSHHPIRWIIVILLLALILTTGWFGYRWYTTGKLPAFIKSLVSANMASSETGVKVSDITSYTVPALDPRYLHIDSLGLSNIRIFPVGLDAKTLLAYPSNIHDIGWYQKSGTPGSGNVILLNSRSEPYSGAGALANASKIQIGDVLSLERGDGTKFSYKVLENKSMTISEVNEIGMKLVSTSATASKEALNIITDSGLYVPQLGTYDHRTIIRSVIVNG